MKEEIFNKLWHSVVSPLHDKYCETLNNNHKDINVYSKNSVAFQRQIYDSYQDNRLFLKTYFYSSGEIIDNVDNSGDDSNKYLIDYHKIAACLCKSFITNKMFKYKVEKDLPSEITLINYKFAYEVSIGCLYYFLKIGYSYTQMENEYKKLLEQGTMVAPQTNNHHDDYHIGRIKTIALNDIYGIPYDILMYSDMLFWIELYTRQKIEGKIDLDPLKFPE